MIKKTVFLIPVLILALVIMSNNITPAYCTNDRLLYTMFAIDSMPNNISSFLTIENYGITNPLRSFASLYSIGYNFYLIMVLTVYNLINIPINESTLAFSSIIIGIIGIGGIYLLSTLFTTKNKSIIISLFYSIFPVYIAWSRATHSMIFSTTILIYTLYFFISYLNNNKPIHGIFASILTAAYIISFNMFPQLLLSMFFIFLIFNKNILKSKKHFINSISKISSWKITTPVILALGLNIAIYLAVKIMNISSIGTNIGIIGHTLAKQKTIGFFIPEILHQITNLTTPLLTVLILISTIVGIKNVIKLKKESILLISALIYTLPFIFFLAPETSSFNVYLFPSIILFTIYTLINILNLKHKKVAAIILIILYITTAISIFPKVYSSDSDKLLQTDGINEEFCSSKTIGYWIRTNTQENDKIFVTSTIGPVVSKYYLNREVYSLFASKEGNELEFLKYNVNKIQVAIVETEKQDIINHLKQNNFKEAIEIIQNNKSNYLVFTKKEAIKMTIFPQEYNSEFNKKYKKLSDFMNTPLYTSNSPAWI